MRVISGKFKGRKLYSPKDERVRPTTDRIKETLFNILLSKKKNVVTVLDLFGGSGAVGIEALSRGAEKCVFIDRDIESVRLIKENLNHVGAKETDYSIYNVDFSFALKKLKDKRFDFIFADPPYASDFEEKIVRLIDKYNVLANDGVLVVEHANDKIFPTENFEVDRRECGYTVLTFLTYRNAEVHNE